jgi:hypothetical protein
MIAVIAAGVGFIVVIAIIVGIVDATQAPTWRRIAAERRMRWEARQPQLHGVDPHEHESWDDD